MTNTFFILLEAIVMMVFDAPLDYHTPQSAPLALPGSVDPDFKNDQHFLVVRRLVSEPSISVDNIFMHVKALWMEGPWKKGDWSCERERREIVVRM